MASLPLSTVVVTALAVLTVAGCGGGSGLGGAADVHTDDVDIQADDGDATVSTDRP